MTTTTLEISTPSDLELAMTLVFMAPARLVFDAWTKPEHLKRWFGPSDWTMDICHIDLRPGGTYRFHMQKNDGEQMGLYGEYREVGAPHRLVNTEFFEQPYFEEMGAGTINTVTLDEADGKTTITATSLYKSREARDIVLSSGMAEGAGESFDRLEELLRAMA